MSEWQPIETAPKDGTQIISFWPCYREGHQVQITSWVNTEHRDHGNVTYSAQYWQAPSLASFTLAHLAPSHWMPVPLAPKQDSVSREAVGG